MAVASRQWAKRFDACCNCQTRRYEHRARGFCLRCHPLIRRLEAAELWDESDPTTLKDCPWRSTISEDCTVLPGRMQLSRVLFRRYKANYMAIIKGRLAFLKSREEMLNGFIDGMTLEMEFNSVAALTKCGDHHAFTNWAGIFDSQFTPDQRLTLFAGLNRIREGIPWEIPWGHVYSDIDWTTGHKFQEGGSR